MSAERSSHAHAVRAFKEKCNQQVGTVAERRKRRADAWEEFKKEVHKTEKRKKKKNKKIEKARPAIVLRGIGTGE